MRLNEVSPNVMVVNITPLISPIVSPLIFRDSNYHLLKILFSLLSEHIHKINETQIKVIVDTVYAKMNLADINKKEIKRYITSIIEIVFNVNIPNVLQGVYHKVRIDIMKFMNKTQYLVIVEIKNNGVL